MPTATATISEVVAHGNGAYSTGFKGVPRKSLEPATSVSGPELDEAFPLFVEDGGYFIDLSRSPVWAAKERVTWTGSGSTPRFRGPHVPWSRKRRRMETEMKTVCTILRWVRPLGSIVLLGTLLLTSCGSDDDQSTAASDSLVQTSLGPVQGVRTGTLLAFLGIPYARPPVDELRFMPPQPPDLWTTPLQADRFGAACPQPFDPYETASVSPQSEDCLSLNVWTPGTDGARRPVMVFIHGGGWCWGGSVDPWYGGAALAERGQVVLVSINYRLGVLGFLYLAEIGGPDLAPSGNSGLLDQVAALEWVRDNIVRFGGDPENVTVFGESAGSMSISALLAMPAARGLFRRAIAESGVSNTLRSVHYAASVTDDFMTYAGVHDVEGLRGLTLEQMVQKEEGYLNQQFISDLFFGPVIDGEVLPEPPLHAIDGGAAAGVDLLTGTNLDETRYWALYSPVLLLLGPVPYIFLVPYVGNAFQAAADPAGDIISAYRFLYPAQTAGQLSMTLATDIFFHVPHVRLADAQSLHQPKTWMYFFTWPSPMEGGKYGSMHALELPFVFGTLDEAKDFIGDDPPRELADRIQDAWIAFARTGDPNHAGLPEWPEYETLHRAAMVLDESSEVREDPFAAERGIWDGVHFDSVTPSVGGRAAR
jgi:para-nitrobenzyl esterase